MKKILLSGIAIVLLSGFFACDAFAGGAETEEQKKINQEILRFRRRKLDYGWYLGGHLGAGLCITSETTTYNEGYESPYTSGIGLGMGPMIGAVGRFAFDNLLSIQLELNYVRKSTISLFSFADSLGGGDFGSSSSIDYIEIPVMGKFQFGYQNVRVFVDLGVAPAFGIIGRSEADSFFGEESTSASATFDKKDNQTRFELTGLIGLGNSVQIGYGRLTSQVRFGYPLTAYKSGPITATYDSDGDGIDDATTEIGEQSAKHFMYYVTVGYMIPIGYRRP